MPLLDLLIDLLDKSDPYLTPCLLSWIWDLLSWDVTFSLIFLFSVIFWAELEVGSDIIFTSPTSHPLLLMRSQHCTLGYLLQCAWGDMYCGAKGSQGSAGDHTQGLVSTRQELYLWVTTRGGTAESYGNSIFSFLKNVHVVSKIGWTHWHSYQKSIRLLFPYILTNTGCFLMYVTISGIRYLIVPLIYISLMITNTWYFFLFLLTICISQ